MGTAIIYGNTAWLAHIIVHKEHRNAGIGTTLTHALIELIHKTPCRTILLIATALGEPVYTKAGFEIDTQYTFLDDGTLPPPSGRANEIKMFDKRYESDLLKLDYRVSGEHREKLFRSHWDAIKICVENGTLKGFYIPTLGEGLIIAEDPGTGFELMKLKYSTSKMFCIPVNNERGINFLTTNGYKEYRKATRMILGKKISWNSGKIYSRIGGNLG